MLGIHFLALLKKIIFLSPQGIHLFYPSNGKPHDSQSTTVREGERISMHSSITVPPGLKHSIQQVAPLSRKVNNFRKYLKLIKFSRPVPARAYKKLRVPL